MNLVQVTVLIFSLTGNKISSSEVLLMHKPFHFNPKSFNRKFQSFMGNICKANCLNLDKVGIDR